MKYIAQYNDEFLKDFNFISYRKKTVKYLLFTLLLIGLTLFVTIFAELERSIGIFFLGLLCSLVVFFIGISSIYRLYKLQYLKEYLISKKQDIDEYLFSQKKCVIDKTFVVIDKQRFINILSQNRKGEFFVAIVAHSDLIFRKGKEFIHYTEVNLTEVEKRKFKKFFKKELVFFNKIESI